MSHADCSGPKHSHVVNLVKSKKVRAASKVKPSVAKVLQTTIASRVVDNNSVEAHTVVQ